MVNKIASMSYFGGKAKLCGKIGSILNNVVHNTYVEPFGGSGIVLLNKIPSKMEIYNDLADNIVNMFQQIRDNYPEFKRKISRHLYAQKEYADAIEKLKDPVSLNIDKAVL